MAAGKVEVGGFDVDGGGEARLVSKDVNIKEGDMKGEGNHDHESTTRRYLQ